MGIGRESPGGLVQRCPAAAVATRIAGETSCRLTAKEQARRLQSIVHSCRSELIAIWQQLSIYLRALSEPVVIVLVQRRDTQPQGRGPHAASIGGKAESLACVQRRELTAQAAPSIELPVGAVQAGRVDGLHGVVGGHGGIELAEGIECRQLPLASKVQCDSDTTQVVHLVGGTMGPQPRSRSPQSHRQLAQPQPVVQHQSLAESNFVVAEDSVLQRPDFLQLYVSAVAVPQRCLTIHHGLARICFGPQSCVEVTALLPRIAPAVGQPPAPRPPGTII